GECLQPVLQQPGDRLQAFRRHISIRLGQKGPHAVRQIGRGQSSNVKSVEPLQFGMVKDSARLAHPLQREPLYEIGEEENLLIRSRRPTTQGQVVHHGLRQISAVLKYGDPSRSVSFAELLAIRAQNGREVGESRRLPAERLLQQEMAGRAINPLVTAENVVYLQHVVVYPVRE